MTREEAKQLFREDLNSYGCVKKVMTKINKIYDDFKIENINDMELTQQKKRIKLHMLPNGKMFKFGSTIALKSEYRTQTGACECHIVGSGEMFWGGTHTAADLNRLLVYPINVTDVI